MSWESPIKVIEQNIALEFDNETVSAVRRVGFDIDKEELLKALTYDRQQYDKGYADAKAELVRCGEWIKHETKVLIWSSAADVMFGKADDYRYRISHDNTCSVCGYHTGTIADNYLFCPNCGAKMGVEQDEKSV